MSSEHPATPAIERSDWQARLRRNGYRLTPQRAPTYHSNTGQAHFHRVCRNCHRVVSVDPDMAASFVTALREQQDFDADLGHLSVHGQCVKCSQEFAEPTVGGHHD